MLDRLPMELLDEVLDLAMSSSPPSRNATARACCLVSQAIRKRAQSLLWRHVHVVGVGGALLLEQLRQPEMGETAKLARTISTQKVDAQTAMSILQLLPAVEEVTLSGTGDGALDLAEVAKVPGLRALHLLSVAVAPLSVPIPFPRLDLLALRCITAAPSTLSSLLSTASLPTLSCLVLERIYDLQRRHDDDTYFPFLPSDLVDQVSLLRIQPVHLRQDIPAELRARDNVLVEIYWSDLPNGLGRPHSLSDFAPLQVRHLRSNLSLAKRNWDKLLSQPNVLSTKIAASLAGLADLLRQPFRPRTIHLSPTPLPHTLPLDGPLRLPVSRLLATVAEVDVRVFWHEQPNNEREMMRFWREEQIEVERVRRSAEATGQDGVIVVQRM
ncbi:hypothetical protein JCM10213_005102 [Rhodosporidiobolus nylandii]